MRISRKATSSAVQFGKVQPGLEWRALIWLGGRGMVTLMSRQLLTMEKQMKAYQTKPM